MQHTRSRGGSCNSGAACPAGGTTAILLFGIAAALLLAAHAPRSAHAHVRQYGIAGKKIVLRSAAKPDRRKFVFKSGDETILPATDPVSTGAAVLVTGAAGRSALAELDPAKWQPLAGGGYKYVDRSGARGGVRKIVFGRGRLTIKAGGPHWAWTGSAGSAIWVLFRVEDEWYCANFVDAAGAKTGAFVAANAPPPASCPAQICGNGVREPSEGCDDGNLASKDSCETDCTIGSCTGDEFDGTLAAIQHVIFDSPTYACTNAACHDRNAPQAGLDLTPGASHASLVGVVAAASVLHRVEPGEPERSLLYQKLTAATRGTPVDGSPMPSGGAPPLSEAHLEAVRRWIRAGAPANGAVEGTASLLGACLPEPDPLKIPPPERPGAGRGVQLRQTAWSLLRQSEDEICMATYYDFTRTSLIPENEQFPCDYGGANNPSGRCFRYHRQVLVQDPQSHHSLIHIYLGQTRFDDPGWGFGPWTYKLDDPSDPLNGTRCDPAAIDPALGFNPGCSGDVWSTVACIGYGPPDWTPAGGPTAPTFSGSQEPYYEQELADGVFSVLPMQGVVVWNSHAFNLTPVDSTMNQYLNIELAAPEDQLYPAQAIFDAGGIFVTNVPPFERREYCRTYTAPPGARLFLLGSHTHRRGVRFRIWEPPNAPCTPGAGPCLPGDQGQLIYTSADYSDPVQLELDPPMALDAGDPRERTFLYCSLYDNGSTPESPAVKRQSTSPLPALPGAPG